MRQFIKDLAVGALITLSGFFVLCTFVAIYSIF
jgi:hypothetical protein